MNKETTPRIQLPPGEQPDAVRLFSMQPVLGKALGGLANAIYSQDSIGLRVREAVRMRVALQNQCLVCIGMRFPGPAAAAGIDEAFYAAVQDWRNSPLLDAREKIAIHYAEKFMCDHLSLDAGFFAQLHTHFTDAEIFALTAIIAGLMANGRILQVLQVAQESCSFEAMAGR